MSEIEAVKVEIQSLTERVRVLDRAADWWNEKMVMSLVLTAIAAILVVLTTVMALKKTRQTNDAQSGLIRAKDRQLALELRDRDVQIEAAKKSAAGANKATEDERTARVALEEGIAWRRLTKEEKDTIGSRLKSFSKQIVRLMYNANDVEAFGFASDVAAALQLAEWDVDEPQPVMRLTEGPVALGTNPLLATGVRVISTGDKPSVDASKAILEELNLRGFDAHKSDLDKRPVRVITLWFEPRPQGPQGDARLRAQKTAKKP